MPRICYTPKNFRADAMEVISQANAIAIEYAGLGYDLTLRQCYYQFVSRDLLPNTEQSYKRLGQIINDARLAGLIDWNHISDRTRWVRDLAHWDNPQSIMNGVVASYRHEKWSNQPERPIAMIEKDALVGVISGVCEELDVPYFSCRGYTSQSEMWSLAQRMLKWVTNYQRPVILHLGDHDPSGMDMTRDITERLALFMEHHGARRPRVDRLALNMDQVDEYSPPPNPAKITDSRFAEYQAEYGDESWELDALNPPVISQLVRDAVLVHRDDGLWAEAEEKESEQRDLLTLARDNWTNVAEYIRDNFV